MSQFVSERSAILLVLLIKLTQETRRRDWRGRDRDGEIGKRQIIEGGCVETFHCSSQTWETCRFTVPPAVALLNYIRSGIFWRIFSQTGIFRGVSLYIINFPVRISEAAIGGAGTLYFIASVVKWVMCTVEHQSFCAVVWFVTSDHPPPPTQMSVGELYRQGIERQRGGEIFHWRGSGGTQIIWQHRDCGTLYNILYSL